MPFIVEVSLSRGNYGPGCQTTEVNHFISYEFLYLGHPTSEQIHMNFSTSDTPKVSHEFLLYLGHLTSQHEFFDLGHAKSEPLQCEFGHMFIGKLKI